MNQRNDVNSLKRLAKQFRQRLARALFTLGIARLTALAIVLFLVFAGADWLFHIPSGWRVLPLAFCIGTLGVLAWWSIILPWPHHWTDKQVLAWLDQRHGQSLLLLDRYELAESAGTEADPLGALPREEAVAALAGTPQENALLGKAIERKRLLRWLLGAGLAGVMLGILAGSLPAYVRTGAARFFNPFSAARWPHRTNIEVAKPEGDWIVAQGEPLAIRVRVSGLEVPPRINLYYRTRAKGNWVREQLTVAKDGNAGYRFAEVREALEFYISGGDDTSDKISIQVTRRPYLEHIALRVASPPYSGIPVRTQEGGDVEGLEGAKATLEFNSSVPLKSAWFAFDGQNERELPLSSPQTFATEFLLARNSGYRVRLAAASGAVQAKPEHYEIRVTPDAPPEAQILSPEKDTDSTSSAVCKVTLSASDDYELSKIEVLYKMGEDPPRVLSSRITGPLPVHCKNSTGEFQWDLSQLELPKKDVVLLDVFVRVSDCNPTGRGVTESSHRQIRVLKPSLYREALLLEAKALVNEAVLAERNQRQAYFVGKSFLTGKGTGEENDPLWSELMTRQSGAADAAQALSAHLARLLDEATSNRIQKEFMASRLTQVAALLEQAIAGQHVPIGKRLDAVRPQNAVAATPAATLARRKEALKDISETENGQKRAALELQRILFLVFDWSDLQSAAVAGVRLYEQQEECSHQTAAIAPIFIGKDIKDLSDADQEKLIVIGKMQRVIYDAETVLEGSLKQILTNAERQRRQSIRAPVYTAFNNLRSRRVNDSLFKASSAIENNQPADILGDQASALEALKLVKAGLEAAGVAEKLAALPLSQEVADIDAENSKKTVAAQDQEDMAPPPLTAVDRIGTDPLTTALLGTNDALLDVVRRSAYLESNLSPENLARFARLRFGRLSALQTLAEDQLAQASTEAEKAKQDFVAGRLKDLRREASGVAGLIAARDIGDGARQIATDCAAALKDETELLASQRAVRQLREEHDHAGGLDPFRQPYILQSGDLATTADLVCGLLELRAEMLQEARLLQRFSRFKAATGARAALEVQERAHLREKQPVLLQEITRLGQLPAKLSDKVRARVAEKLGDALNPNKIRPLLVAAKDKETERAAKASAQSEQWAAVIRDLRDLLDARGERPRVVTADKTSPPVEIAKMTAEEYEKTVSLAAMKERVAHSSSLPEEIREPLLKSLAHDFPPDQQRLLSAYVKAILSAHEEEKK